jgi:hypothetical protein
MQTDRAWLLLLPLPMLLWPALLNGYPLVFSDTGTYLSQAIHLYLGWDRPAFYSLFMMALHMTLTTWPVVLAQAVCVVLMLECVRGVFFPTTPRPVLPVLLLALSLLTGLPWLISRLMPDLFTPLLVLAMAVLIFVPERLAPRWRWLLVLAAVAMTAVHQSNVLLCLGLLAALVPLRRRLGAQVALGRQGLLRLALVPVLALAALTAVNLAAHRVASPSPFGNVFLLARVIYDGPGLRVLQRDCPQAGWRLCAELGDMPPTSDDFLWLPDGPLVRAGGAKIVSREATAIILAALWAEPWTQLRAIAANSLEQLGLFSPGDGLHAWPEEVSPWIARDFPDAERRRYEAARQTRGALVVPAWTETADRASVVVGLAGLVVVFVRAVRRRCPSAGLCAAIFLAVLGNAVITGGLSCPHDRYQSRVIWLPAAVVLLALPGGRLLSGLHGVRLAGRAVAMRASTVRSRGFPAPIATHA